jgi:hypothetical protein
VAGDADPDLFVVDKPTRQIVEARVGSKQAVITLNQSGGTKKSIRENHQETSITNEQALALTDLLQKVEAHYQKPIDIEWAIAGEKIYLLQARPITTYRPLPAEMVTAPGEPKRLYANSTLIEQGLQEPLSVLGTDFLNYVLNKVGGPVAEGAIGLDGITFTASGGYYMNISFALMMGMKNAALAPGSFGDPRVMALMQALCLFLLIPEGFANLDLRVLVAALLGQDPADYKPGRMTYDLRRLRLHGLIERKPHSNRYVVTPEGKRIALFFVRAEARFFRVVLSLETQLNPNSAPDALLEASQAIDRLIQGANLATP